MKSVRIAPGHTIIPDTQLFGMGASSLDYIEDPEESLDGSLGFHDAHQELDDSTSKGPASNGGMSGKLASLGSAAVGMGGAAAVGIGVNALSKDTGAANMDMMNAPIDFNASMAFGMGDDGLYGDSWMNDSAGINIGEDGVISDNFTGEYYFNSVSQVPEPPPADLGVTNTLGAELGGEGIASATDAMTSSPNLLFENFSSSLEESMVFDSVPTDLGIVTLSQTGGPAIGIGNKNAFMEASMAFESIFPHDDDVPSLKSSDGGSDDGDVDVPNDRRSMWQQQQQMAQQTMAEQVGNGAVDMATKVGLKVLVERFVSNFVGAISKIMGGGSEEDDAAAILSSTQAKEAAAVTATNESSRNLGTAAAFYDPSRYVCFCDNLIRRRRHHCHVRSQ
jgi:hypothetical protein